MNFLSFFCSMKYGKNEIKKETSFEDLCEKNELWFYNSKVFLYKVTAKRFTALLFLKRIAY
jgi:hypothetical protein